MSQTTDLTPKTSLYLELWGANSNGDQYLALSFPFKFYATPQVVPLIVTQALLFPMVQICRQDTEDILFLTNLNNVGKVVTKGSDAEVLIPVDAIKAYYLTHPPMHFPQVLPTYYIPHVGITLDLRPCLYKYKGTPFHYPYYNTPPYTHIPLE
jgi:hypothetical protein